MMISVNMSTLFGDETEKIVQGILEATNNIISYKDSSFTSKSRFSNLFQDIEKVCCFWTGNTYVGIPKNQSIKEAFQCFFTELMNVLLKMKESKTDYEVEKANLLLYRGNVYRYLGNGQPVNNASEIQPIYNDIYVSWSKQPENNYLLDKLYGTVTWMACKITSPLYGIDLEAMGCSRGKEDEVVFPTIKEFITEIKYISEEDYE